MSNKKLAVVMVAILTMSLVGVGAVAAAPTIDTETTDTSYTSETADNSTYPNFNGTDNTTQNVTLNHLNDSADDVAFKFVDPNTGTVYHVNESLVNVSGPHASGSYYNGTWTREDLADAEISLNQNKTLNLVAYNVSNESDSNTYKIHLNSSGENRVVENVGSGDIGDESTDIATVLNEEGFFNLSILSTDETTIDTSTDYAVNGSGTTFTLVFSNASASEDYSNNIGDSTDPGDKLWSMTSVMEGDDSGLHGVIVYYQEAPDSVEDGDTYGVYKEDIGGENGIVYHLGDDFEDDTSIDSFKSFSDAGWITQIQEYGVSRVTQMDMPDFDDLNPLAVIEV